MERITLLETLPEKDYELLDSGDGEKLERYGRYVVARPDPQALWKKRLSPDEWQRADARFVPQGRSAGWKKSEKLPDAWDVSIGGVAFRVKLAAFKHVGIFPEQAHNWEWIREATRSAKRKISVLNLFGYTGGATIAALQAGASVVHVDGSRSAIGWARENAVASNVADQPVRWIVDDARAFLRRERKRGHRYDGVVMDPPAFGHGPKGELWKIEKHFLDLLSLVKSILSDNPRFILLNGYASGYSALAYANNIAGIVDGRGGIAEQGELTIRESPCPSADGKRKDARLLPAGIFARWHAAP